MEDCKERRGVGEWINGDEFDYEFAYRSACVRMEHAGWHTRKEATSEV